MHFLSLGVTSETVRTWAAVAGALATTAAVLLALYRDTFREWRLRPKLSLAFGGPPLDAITVLVPLSMTPEVNVSSHWLRLAVSNGEKRRSARDVRVLVTSIYRIDGRKEEWHPLDTVALRWSNLPEVTDVVDLPPATSRRVDVANLVWPTGQLQVPQDGDSGCWAQLQVIPTPSSDRDHLEPGRYRLELTLTAWDVDAVRYSVDLVVDGTWCTGSEIWSHFFLANLRKIR